jgi:hypothetical protein
MTLDEFIVELTQTGTGWGLAEQRFISRPFGDDDMECPITAVHNRRFTGRKATYTSYRSAGQALGLSARDIDKIVDASDSNVWLFSDTETLKALRTRLLTALAIEEPQMEQS